jgi:glycosyltransferase involved in cell wall biosynthesis
LNTPFFSICIPNYNYCDFLKITIESILLQTFQDFEIIIADNASTDKSVELVKSYEDNRIKLIENPFNIGFSPNLDIATQKAKGKYMILLSSDDVMLPNALETYYKIINQIGNDNVILMSSCAIIDSKGQRIGKKNAMTGDVYSYLNKMDIKPYRVIKDFEANFYKSNDVLSGVLSNSFQPAGQFLTTCYSSNLYNLVNGYRSIMSVHPDAHFSHKLLFNNPIVVYVNLELFEYRVHQMNNLSATVNLANIKYLIDSYLFTQIYDNQLLSKIGLNSDKIKSTFVNKIILHDAIWAIIRGKISKGLRILLFGLSAYPRIIFKKIKFLLFIILLLFSPIFWFYTRIIYYIKIK